MLTVKRRNGKLTILVDDSVLLTGVELVVNTTSFENLKLEPVRCKKADGAVCVSFKGATKEPNKYVVAELSVKEIPGAVSLNLNAECKWSWREDIHTFRSHDGVYFRFDATPQIDKLCALYMVDSYWTLPHFGTDMAEIPARTQALMYQKNSQHVCYMTKCMDNAFTELFANNGKMELRCADYSGNIPKLTGEMMTIGISDRPEESIKACYHGILERAERKYPEVFEYLGWCSWNAFYKNLTEAGFESKLQEFRDKKLPVKWMIIDDGWMQIENDRLLSMKEDPKKFPKGLGAFNAKMREKFDIDYIGIWVSFTGYWDSIARGSELYLEQYQNLYEAKSGIIVPSGQGAFDFWSTWFKYLKQQGIDFVKVDTQGSYRVMGSGCDNLMQTCQKANDALDAASEIHFNGNMLNCMSMGKENAFQRPISGLMRNSGDYTPTEEKGLLRHLRQNALNSLFFGHITYTDWDMWWSKHETATQSGVMRAISGGPVYVSDEVGATQPEQLWPLIEDDGRIIRCDQPPVPTDDCIYENCDGGVMKLRNTCGDCGVLAVFCFDEKGRDIAISGSDVKMTEPAVGYCYFSKRFFLLEEGTTIHLEYEGAEIINFYPIRDGKVQLGDLTKYVSAGSSKKETVSVSDILK